ncbi:transposase [Streptomyces sp. NBC_00385]|uniref:transposase n=1 Tax=Streptomyces sp. NBC_00385 TaxID=2975733 RepID=UPI002DDC69D6|nr:transposase [Streptomyces sp. NBC_00385]WRZ09273.1 transposase [Streptomyces sp. NBC_00385]
MLGRPSECRRNLINRMRRRVRTGVPWRDLPAEYGPWQTVYGLFRLRQRDVWSSVLTRLQARADAVGLIAWEVIVDPAICRAHQHASCARRDGRKQSEPDDHGLGWSRSSWTTKIHLACEQGQRPLLLLVAAGQRGDSPQFTAVLEAIWVPRLGLGRPRVSSAAGARRRSVSSRVNRACLRQRGIRCTIPEPADQQATVNVGGAAGGRPPAFDREDCKARHAADAASTCSGGTGPWPHGSTRSGSAAERPSSSPRSTSGSDLSDVSVPHVILAAIRSADRGETVAMGGAYDHVQFGYEISSSPGGQPRHRAGAGDRYRGEPVPQRPP